MKIMKVKSCYDCPLTTTNSERNILSLMNIDTGCTANSEHDTYEDIYLMNLMCILTRKSINNYNYSVPRNCPLEDE